MNEGKLGYVKFGKVGANNCMNLSHCNILPRAYQWAHCRMKNGFYSP